MGNTFTDCVKENVRDQDFFFVCSVEDETELNIKLGDNITRGNIRLCVTCKKSGPCVMCKACKSVYYCDDVCQAQDWGEIPEVLYQLQWGETTEGWSAIV